MYIHFFFHLDREEYHNARTLWKDTHDASAVLPIFPKRGFAERKLLSFYIRNPEQHAKAIKSVSINKLIHAIIVSHAIFVFCSCLKTCFPCTRMRTNPTSGIVSFLSVQDFSVPINLW